MAASQALSAYLKEVYSKDGMANLVPDGAVILKKIPFKHDEKIGDKYIVPVQLTGEHGFSAGTGLIALNAAIAHVASEAQVSGGQLILRSQISYEQAARASESKAAFAKWTDARLIPFHSSMQRRVAFNCLYGNMGLGTVSANDTGVLTISTATFAPGAWLGMEGAVLEAFTAVSGGSQHDTSLTVTAVDIEARTVTVSGTSTAVVEGDILFLKGTRTKEMDGLDKIITATTTQFNIDPSTYGLWKGNSYSAGSAALSIGKIISAVARAVNKGLAEDVVCLVNPKAYANLNSAESSLRQYGVAKDGENGFETLRFHSSNGLIEIVPCLDVKEGDAFIFPPKQCMRIGSSDVTMKMPGKESDELVLQIPDYSGYEMRLFTEQQVFCRTPGHMVKITGIVNS
jgi:hypothetical protein